MDQSKLSSKAASAVRSGTKSVIRSAVMTSLLMRKQLWIWPVLAAVILGICGWLVSRSVEDALRERRIAALTTILDADVAALQIWIAEQIKDAELIAHD